jgi:hypothetical protein
MKAIYNHQNAHRIVLAAAYAAGLGLAAGCSGESQEAERVELPVVVDALADEPVENDLGWRVDIETFEAAIADLEFTTEGEQHDSSSTVTSLLIPPAYAHPGHHAGGQVIGELPGRFVVDWVDGDAELGSASLITGDYTGANFRFAAASTDDGLAAADKLVGHSIHIAGVARRDGASVAFDAFVDQDTDRRVIGAPFEATVTADAEATLVLRAHPLDPEEEDTLFDGIDFGTLDADGDGQVTLEADTAPYNRLKRALQVHDHYSIAKR